MANVYERISAGETLRVHFKPGLPGRYKKPFKVGPLWMLGDMYATESSEWKKFAKVGGVTINGRRRHRMGPGELAAWCNTVELIEDRKEN